MKRGWLFFGLILIGCEETVQLDLNQVPPRVVIEGLVTDAPGRQYVKVSRSAGFYQSGATEKISTATVTVADDQGEVTTFAHYAGANPDSVGFYFPAATFAGVIGRTYSLKVSLDGELYEASDKLLRMGPLDSLSYRPNISAVNDPPSDGKTYEVLIYAKEPRDTEDYYLFKFYRNDSLTFRDERTVYVFNDVGLGENINGVPTDVLYAVGDKAKVEMYSITRDGYLFYSDLATLLNSDGGMFSPPPANPRSNIRGNALGYFQVSGVTGLEITVK